MKVIIAGSRNIIDYSTVIDAVFNCSFEITEIVSGGARGVDTLAIAYAKEFGFPYIIKTALWDLHGKSAGYKRNLEMARYADALIAVWDGQSKGTGHMINEMNKLGKPVYIYAATVS